MIFSTTPAPGLLEQIASTPRFRRNGLWPDTPHIVVCARKNNAVEACSAVAAHCPKSSIDAVCLLAPEEFCMEIGDHTIPVINAERLIDYPQCEVALFWRDCVAPDLLYYLETAISHTLSISIFPRVPIGTGRRHDPELYLREGRALEQIYKRLADDESRLAFASVVKGLLMGEIDWVRPPSCGEYLYPPAAARKGDIVIDAGLFDSVVLRRFAISVGSAGHVYGFEPEPSNFAYVCETLEKYGDPGNISVVKSGLYSEKGEMRISAQGSSGMLNPAEDIESTICRVADLDSFVMENSIKRVDLIKMDIEGAEMSALSGAKETIRKYRPRMHICAYHNTHDLVEIPAFIESLDCGYKLYFGTHAPYLNEFVYYFVPKK